MAVREKHPAWGARKIAYCLKREGRLCQCRPPCIGSCAGTRIEPSETRRRTQDIASRRKLRTYRGRWISRANVAQQWDAMPPADHGGRSFALRALSEGLRQRAAADGARASDGRLPPLWLAGRLYTDNGSPWGDTSGGRWTGLRAWLLKLGVRVVHARPYHPQGRGKNERFHRTLKAEVFAMRRFRSLPEIQRSFDAWRSVYTLERPHGRLGWTFHQPISAILAPCRIVSPGSSTTAARSSAASLPRDPSLLPGPSLESSTGLRPRTPGDRPLDRDGHYGIYFASWQIAAIDLTNGKVSVMSPNRCQPCPRAKHLRG